MAAIFGIDPDRLHADHNTMMALAETCADCRERRPVPVRWRSRPRGLAACPRRNAGSVRMPPTTDAAHAGLIPVKAPPPIRPHTSPRDLEGRGHA